MAADPHGQKHLLLIAAGELLDKLVDVRRFDLEFLPVFRRVLPALPELHKAVPRQTVDVGSQHIVRDRHPQEQALVLPVLRDVGQLLPLGAAGGVNMDLFSVQIQLPALRAVYTEDAFEKLRAARAFQACQAEHLTGMQTQRYVFDVVFIADVFQPKDLFSDLAGAGAVLIHDVAPDHIFDQLFLAGLRYLQRFDVLAVTHDRDRIADLEDLLQTVRNINDGYAPVMQGAHDLH